jgi:hypothetical protein
MTTDFWTYSILGLLAALIAVALWRSQKGDNTFDMLDLLMENGRASRTAAAFATSLVVTSWLMLKLCVDGKMTEGYLVIYGGLWVTPILTRMFAQPPSVKERDV